MVTRIINILKKNPLIWRWAKKAVYGGLSVKARIITGYYNLWIKFVKANGVTANIKKETPLIVSFTSYGKRINKAHITAATLLSQSLKPNRVILWLGFGENISPKLAKLQKHGLEIMFCEDLRSYKKFIPALELYPQSIIVTADDDIIYPKNWLQKLYKAHLQNPKAICCHRAHLITKNLNNKVNSYNDWNWCITHTTNIANIFPTGVGGALYPPGSLHPEVLNSAAFKELCPYADDIWLKAMSLKQGTLCHIIEDRPLLIPLSAPGTQSASALRVINIDENQNDVQFKNVFTRYDLYKLLD